jgi:sialidase-1
MTQWFHGIRHGLLAVVVVLSTRTAAAAADKLAAIDVFCSGTQGYHTFRIPSLIVSPRGTLLAFCEGRKTSRADDGDIDLVLSRSTDGGQSWGPLAIVHEEGGTKPITIGNPCPVVDQAAGTIWLPFCRDNDDVFVTSSADDGQTWSAPRDITNDVKQPEWGWYATGPGVGIQLRHGKHAGRLLIPCDHGQSVDGRRVMFSHVFYSDDHGRTWKLGGTVDRHTDECQVVELARGELLINMRNNWGREGMRSDRAAMRAIARSADGGATWSPLDFDPTLVEPICQASLIGIPRPDNDEAPVLVFSNPASKVARREMTVRLSFDAGHTWPDGKLIDAGPAAYSCLARLPDGRIGLLYERDNYRSIAFVVVPLELAAPRGT